MLAAIRRAVAAFAPATPADPVEIALERILAGDAPNAVALDLELDSETTLAASRRAAALRPKPKPCRRRQVTSVWPLIR